MKATELRKKNNKALRDLLVESREKLRMLRFSLTEGQMKNVKEIKETKKNIARILTVLKSKEIKNKD